MRIFLKYFDQELECNEETVLRFKSMDKLVFLKRPIYSNKNVDGWNIWGTKTRKFSDKFQKVKKWSVDLDIALFRELHDKKLIKSIATYEKGN